VCGIAGVLDPAAGTPAGELAALAQGMADRLAHRGPDDAGCFTDGEAGIALGHRRLSVIDLSPAGHQPMCSASGRYVITYNGECYDHPALRRRLEAEGVRFRGHSDTEVLLAAIDRWGPRGALAATNGMFAFALWDRTERTLLLARDRVGEKPLYYGWVGRRFVFASQPGAFRAVPGFAARVDRGVLAAYLRLGYVPPPASLLAGFATVPPGATVTVTSTTAPGVMPDPDAYWSAAEEVAAARAAPFAGGEDDALVALEELLTGAVRERLVADVPVGAFLSGGIDSSLVVALAAGAARGPVRTYSIGSDDPRFDEAADARRVAAHLGTAHTEWVVTAADALGLVERLDEIWDEPFADPSQIPTRLVAGLARREVTVVLSGDGGDELFGGYNRYTLGRALWRRAGRVPPGVRRLAGRAAGAVPAGAVDTAFGVLDRLLPRRARLRTPADKWHKLAEVLGATDPDDLYVRLASAWPDPARLVPGAAERRSAAIDPAAWPPGAMEERMMFADLVAYLPGDTLVKVDRASMAVGLEARVPLLDPRVVRFAWGLPLDLRIRPGRSKHLLRALLARHVPPALWERPKMGFDPPVGEWLRGPLREWAETLLAPSRLAAEGFLDPDVVAAAWRRHRSGRRTHTYALWAVLMFQAWRQRWGAT
jgi:asparagine synthase (glutamine-hydrolysing)